MAEEDQFDLLSPIKDLEFVQFLLADLHDDLAGKIARFRHLADLSQALGSSGTLMPGGETTFAAWTEARTSFIHGNYSATMMLCQGLAEHILAAHLALDINNGRLPQRIRFRKRSIAASHGALLRKATLMIYGVLWLFVIRFPTIGA